MSYEIDYIKKGYINVWWDSEDGGIIYTAEFRCYSYEEGIYEAMVIDSYLTTSKYKLQYPLTNKELKETSELVEDWFYNNPENI
jgi:hypothetical protein